MLGDHDRTYVIDSKSRGAPTCTKQYCMMLWNLKRLMRHEFSCCMTTLGTPWVARKKPLSQGSFMFLPTWLLLICRGNAFIVPLFPDACPQCLGHEDLCAAWRSQTRNGHQCCSPQQRKRRPPGRHLCQCAGPLFCQTQHDT